MAKWKHTPFRRTKLDIFRGVFGGQWRVSGGGGSQEKLCRLSARVTSLAFLQKVCLDNFFYPCHLKHLPFKVPTQIELSYCLLNCIMRITIIHQSEKPLNIAVPTAWCLNRLRCPRLGKLAMSNAQVHLVASWPSWHMPVFGISPVETFKWVCLMSPNIEVPHGWFPGGLPQNQPKGVPPPTKRHMPQPKSELAALTVARCGVSSVFCFNKPFNRHSYEQRASPIVDSRRGGVGRPM